MASGASGVFKRYGALGFVGNWGEDAAQGKTNCLNSAVMRKDAETVMFSWVIWPDRATRDCGNMAVMADPDPDPDTDTDPGGPGMETAFDGTAMIYDGFAHRLGDALAAPGRINATVIPVPADKRADYTAPAKKMADLLIEYGSASALDARGGDLAAIWRRAR
ncbi:MAG: DUF1428 family protein [Hyphomonas sp.]|uniref:DUF1428 family protein n=1 Tax=Hyphomonas sp. TaxID=87 RepID=UPI0034A024D6